MKGRIKNICILFISLQALSILSGSLFTSAAKISANVVFNTEDNAGINNDGNGIGIGKKEVDEAYKSLSSKPSNLEQKETEKDTEPTAAIKAKPKDKAIDKAVAPKKSVVGKRDLTKKELDEAYESLSTKETTEPAAIKAKQKDKAVAVDKAVDKEPKKSMVGKRDDLVNDTEQKVDKQDKASESSSSSASSTNGSSANKKSPQPSPRTIKRSNAYKKNNEFLTWCKTILGIQTLLTIQDFTYTDHLNEWRYQRDDIDNYNILPGTEGNELKTAVVRGLAAARDIQVGEVVISVPYHALITLHTTIDHDPVLSQILGPSAREKYGWTLHKTSNSSTSSSTTSYYEIALLIVALLYHASLGRLSPLWFYVETLVEAPVDQMPYLWNDDRLREELGSYEVKKLVRGIKKDIREMYDSIMEVLIEEHGGIFAPPMGDAGEVADEKDNAWMFSYERFEWAFAMVNSRHWHLPLQDLDEAMMELRKIREDPDPAEEHSMASADAINSMPANQPTEEYVSLHDEALKMEHIEEYVAPSPAPATLSEDSIVTKHSFMAPLADMLNFGPPCARGQYNTKKKAFEVVATCPFLEGQEVTFWYSDDCDDVIISNYGFTHPMVPRCPTIEDWKYRNKMWKDYAETLEKTLNEAYEDLYDTLQELKSCDCHDGQDNGDSDRNIVYVAPDYLPKRRQELQEQKLNNEVNGQGGIRRTKQRSFDEEKEEIGL